MLRMYLHRDSALNWRRVCWVLLVGGLLLTNQAHAQSVVHLEVIQEAGGAIDAAQRWLQQLQRLSLASVKFRAPRPGDKPQVQTRGTADRPVYQVTAVLTVRNELRVPNAVFRQGDLAGLSRWLDNLQPAERPESPTAAFGLSARELVQLTGDLAAPLQRSTAGEPIRSVVAGIQSRIRLPLVIDPSARASLSKPIAVEDELQGLAQGTALAAALRPAGLGLVPERNDRDRITLRVVAAAAVPEIWPVGWPSKARPQESVPKLFEFLPVEIADIPLSRALAAIQPRLEVPLLIDRNGLAARQIDLDSIKVRYPAGRTFYKKLLDRLLFQAQLEMEVRVDEGERPFLWVQPLKR